MQLERDPKHEFLNTPKKDAKIQIHAELLMQSKK